jgi:hypothetical protein
MCGILQHGGGLASSDRATAHALNSGNTELGGITLTTSHAPVAPGPRKKLRISGTIASVVCTSKSVVFQRTTSAKNHKQSVNVGEVSTLRFWKDSNLRFCASLWTPHDTSLIHLSERTSAALQSKKKSAVTALTMVIDFAPIPIIWP